MLDRLRRIRRAAAQIPLRINARAKINPTGLALPAYSRAHVRPSLPARSTQRPAHFVAARRRVCERALFAVRRAPSAGRRTHSGAEALPAHSAMAARRRSAAAPLLVARSRFARTRSAIASTADARAVKTAPTARPRSQRSRRLARFVPLFFFPRARATQIAAKPRGERRPRACAAFPFGAAAGAPLRGCAAGLQQPLGVRAPAPRVCAKPPRTSPASSPTPGRVRAASSPRIFSTRSPPIDESAQRLSSDTS